MKNFPVGYAGQTWRFRDNGETPEGDVKKMTPNIVKITKEILSQLPQNKGHSQMPYSS